MDGSDDYFTDDIVLDAQTLALLDQQEQQFLSQSSVKRQKTDTGWKPGVKTYSAEDLDDLPEISVQGDGSYGVRSDSTTAPSSLNAVTNQPISLNVPRAKVATASTSRVIPHPLQQPVRNSGYNQSSHLGRGLPRPHESNRFQTGRPQPHPRAVSTGPHRPLPHAVTHGDTHPLVAQVEELQQKLNELHQENSKIQAILKEETDSKFAKAGEVSILRKSIEKAAQDHASQIAKLKAAKEEADTRQMQVQREMKEEMARLKTQYMFKQHELDSSTRKPPMSARTKKVYKDPPTPMRMPSQIRQWNQNAITRASGSQSTSRIKDSPTQRPRNSPQNFKLHPLLPGFQNSFITSTPMQIKGKQKLPEAPLFTYPSNGLAPQVSPPSSPTRPQHHDTSLNPKKRVLNHHDAFFDQDVIMDDDGDADILDEDEDESISERLDDAEPINWNAELSRIVLTHSLPSAAQTTFQILLGTPISTNEPVASLNTFSAACTQILEALANSSKYNAYDIAINHVSQSLLQMLSLLSTANSLVPLVSLLHMLTMLSNSLPTFVSSILSSSDEKTDLPQILVFLCDIIQSHMGPSKQSDHKEDIGRETLSLLESLFWSVSGEMSDKFILVASSQDVLMTLLHTSQPSWLLTRSARFILFLSTYNKLSQSLLCLPSAELPLEKATADLTRIPHIERLCSYLIDPTRQDNEYLSLKTYILALFATLSMSHPDAHSILVGSHSLIPSLVIFLTNLTTPLWEDDEKLMSTSEALASAISTINQTLFLLHHLVFNTEPVFNLRHKLLHAPHRSFNGATHMFIVALGRLSYADPPDWITLHERHELELLTEMAKDLLDLVVDGPEGDNVWAAYQAGTGQDSDTDEEEMEARLLGNES